MRHASDPRSLWAFTGVAVRCGQRMGLHRDGESLGLPPFDTEMRRRLWWQIVILDCRTAELAGTGVSVMANLWDTRIPLNINDSDLSPDMQQLPKEHAGPTEMMHCLLRYSIGQVLRSPGSFNAFDGAWQRLSSSTVPLAEKDGAIDELENLIQDKFLKYCDPTIPLHLMTSMLGRAAIASMRLVAHHPRQYPDKGAHLSQDEKEKLFAISLKVIEIDNLAHSTKSLHRFLWHGRAYFQWHAFIYLMSELCVRTLGEQVEKAWQQVNEALGNHFEHIDASTNALNVAVQSLVTKAWYLRVADSLHQHQLAPQAPPFVAKLLTGSNTADAQSSGGSAGGPGEPRTISSTESNKPYQWTATTYGDFNPPFDADLTPLDSSQVDWAEWDAMLQDVDLLNFQCNGNPP